MTDEDAASTIDVVIVAFNSAARLRALLPTVVGANGIGIGRRGRSRLGRLGDHRRGGGCGLDPRRVEPRVRRRAEQRSTADDRTIRARAEPGPDDRHRRRHPRRRSLRGSDDRRRAGRHPGGVDGCARAQRRATLRAVAPLGAADPRPRPAAARSRTSCRAPFGSLLRSRRPRLRATPSGRGARCDCDPLPSRSVEQRRRIRRTHLHVRGGPGSLCPPRCSGLAAPDRSRGLGGARRRRVGAELVGSRTGVLERNLELRSAELVDAGLARRPRGRDRPSSHVVGAATAPILVRRPRSRGRTDPSPARPTR